MPLFTASAFAYYINLAWDPSSDEDIAGYIVHYGKASRRYQYSADIGDFTTCTISGLKEGPTYYFAVTAYNFDDIESDYSEEISYSQGSAPGPGNGIRRKTSFGRKNAKLDRKDEGARKKKRF
jgi:hypothetical protein